MSSRADSQVVLALPLTVLAIGASLANLDHRLVQAARSLGARPMVVFTRVILPNIVPGIAAGALLAFVVSWDEITVTLFGGMDPSLYADLKATRDTGFWVATAETTLRTWFHRGDRKVGKVLDWTETANPPPGSSISSRPPS